MKTWLVKMFLRWTLTLILSNLKADDVVAQVENAEKDAENKLKKKGIVYRYLRSADTSLSESAANLATELGVALYKKG